MISSIRIGCGLRCSFQYRIVAVSIAQLKRERTIRTLVFPLTLCGSSVRQFGFSSQNTNGETLDETIPR